MCLVVVEVDLLDIAANAGREDARESLDGGVLVWPVNLSNVHQGGDGLGG